MWRKCVIENDSPTFLDPVCLVATPQLTFENWKEHSRVKKVQQIIVPAHFPPDLGADLGEVGISTCKLPVRKTATYWSWPFELATDLFSDFQLIHMRLEIESLQILFIVDMQVWRNANMKLLQGIYIAVCTVLRCWKLSNSSSAQSNIHITSSIHWKFKKSCSAKK